MPNRQVRRFFVCVPVNYLNGWQTAIVRLFWVWYELFNGNIFTVSVSATGVVSDGYEGSSDYTTAVVRFRNGTRYGRSFYWRAYCRGYYGGEVLEPTGTTVSVKTGCLFVFLYFNPSTGSNSVSVKIIDRLVKVSGCERNLFMITMDISVFMGWRVFVRVFARTVHRCSSGLVFSQSCLLASTVSRFANNTVHDNGVTGGGHGHYTIKIRRHRWVLGRFWRFKVIVLTIHVSVTAYYRGFGCSVCLVRCSPRFTFYLSTRKYYLVSRHSIKWFFTIYYY